MKILVVYYSSYGHIHRMAEAVVEGAKGVSGADVELRRVPETLPEEILRKMGAFEAQQKQAHIPVCTVEDLPRRPPSSSAPRPDTGPSAAR